MPNAAALPEIEIFRAGKHVDVNGLPVEVTHADLAAIAAAYDPAKGEAPHVVGHPKLNAPAYGWVKKLSARDGVLFAASDQVDPAFAEIVSAGRYKKRSASFFLPNSPGNPKPGAMYLRHVGWLGATAPAVTGLRDVNFAADNHGVVEFSMNARWGFGYIADMFRRLRDRLIETDSIEKADELLPDWQINALKEAAQSDESGAVSYAAPTQDPPAMNNNTNTADFAARESAVTAKENDIASRERALREKEQKAQRDGIVEFAAGLVKTGKLLPRQQAPVVELLVAIESAEPKTLSFAASDGTQTSVTAGAALRTLLGELPVQVDFAERGAGEAVTTSVEFAAPQGAQVNRDRLELHAKAVAYQGKHPNTSYLDAVRAVGG